MTLPPQTIIRLGISNFKKLTAVEIVPKPGENIVTIGGFNGAGKSCVLDSISAVFGGGKSMPEVPVREGEETAVILCETQDLIVKRRISASGSTVVITSRADAKVKYSSPQEVLDAFYGQIGFDPAAFQRMKPEKQLETLRDLLGLDFTEIEAKRKECYDARTEVGRQRTVAQGALTSTPKHAGVPLTEVSISDLSEKLKKAQAANKQREQMAVSVRDAEFKLTGLTAAVTDLEEKLKDIQAQLDTVRTVKDKQTADLQTLRETAELFTGQDEAPIIREMENIQGTNAKVRSNIALAKHQADVIRLSKEYDEYTAALDYIEAAKQKSITDAKFPVSGLSFGAKGVLFNGKPFDQASTAEQIRISVAMGISLNPNLKVILIRDGSLLDSVSFSVIQAMATEYGYQIWIEVVTDTEEEEAACTVVISDGAVKS